MSDGSMARRLLFRRIFTPAFPTTFNNINIFEMRAAGFRKFIHDPKNDVREKMSEDGIPPTEQQELEQLEFDWDEVQQCEEAHGDGQSVIPSN